MARAPGPPGRAESFDALAAALGDLYAYCYDADPAEVRRAAELRAEAMDVSDDWVTAAYLPLGYPEGRGFGSLSRKPVEAVTFLDRWDRPLF